MSRVPEGVLASEVGVYVPDDELTAKSVVHVKGGQKKGDKLEEGGLVSTKKSAHKMNGNRETSKKQGASKASGSSNTKEGIRQMQLEEEAAVRARVEDRIRKARAALLAVAAFGDSCHRAEKNREIVHSLLSRLASIAYPFLKSQLLGETAAVSLQSLSNALARPRLRATGSAFVGALRQVAFNSDPSFLATSSTVTETIKAMSGELLRSGRPFPPQVYTTDCFQK